MNTTVFTPLFLAQMEVIYICVLYIHLMPQELSAFHFFYFLAMIFIINYFYNGRIILKFEFFENPLMQFNSMDVEWNAVDIR